MILLKWQFSKIWPFLIADIKACIHYFSLFLKEKYISLLFRTKYIEKKFNLQLFFRLIVL